MTQDRDQHKGHDAEKLNSKRVAQQAGKSAAPFRAPYRDSREQN